MQRNCANDVPIISLQPVPSSMLRHGHDTKVNSKIFALLSVQAQQIFMLIILHGAASTRRHKRELIDHK